MQDWEGQKKTVPYSFPQQTSVPIVLNGKALMTSLVHVFAYKKGVALWMDHENADERLTKTPTAFKYTE